MDTLKINEWYYNTTKLSILIDKDTLYILPKISEVKLLSTNFKNDVGEITLSFKRDGVETTGIHLCNNDDIIKKLKPIKGIENFCNLSDVSYHGDYTTIRDEALNGMIKKILEFYLN